MNYFELFNLPFQFDVDIDSMTDVYHQLQREVHPDRFAHAPGHEQLQAVQKSAQVNDAFATLKNPLLRAQYMLAEQGVDMQIEHKTLQDRMFLMQQMELREQLEDIAQMDDPAGQIGAFESQIETLTASIYQQLKPLLVSNCKVSLENAADMVRKLKFMHKLRDELSRLEDSLL